MSRGNGKMQIFLDDGDYRHFVHLLGETVEGLGIRCWNYCVMPNHYHVTVQPTRPNLSEAVRKLNSTYAQWWNRRHERVGHVFQGRFKDQIVDRDGYLITLSKYVVMNPVRAGLVERPEDWPWSSYRATVGASGTPAFLAVTSTLGLFGDAENALLQDRFAQFVKRSDDDAASIDRIRSEERILGSHAFKEFVTASAWRMSDAQLDAAPVE